LSTLAPAHAAEPLLPKASILVDADTGAVIEARNVHEALPPASVTKIVTGLATVSALPPDAVVPVSPRAAGMPARQHQHESGPDLEARGRPQRAARQFGQ